MLEEKNNVILKTLHIGFSFLLLFTAYNLAVGVLTTVFANVGFYSFALIYLPYAFCSLFSPWIGKRLGLRFCLLLGSITYILWMMSLGIGNLNFLLTMSFINGIGCALLWVHEGIWLSALVKADNCRIDDGFETANSLDSFDSFFDSVDSFDGSPNDISNVSLEKGKGGDEPDIKKEIVSKNKRTGLITGLFFGIYNLNGILGSTTVMLTSYYLQITDILWVLFGIGAVSWILFWTIPYPSKDKWTLLWNKLVVIIDDNSSLFDNNQNDNNNRHDNDNDNDDYNAMLTKSVLLSRPSGRINLVISQTTSQGLADHFKKLWKVLKIPGFALLVPLILQCSMLITFTYGVLPILLSGDLRGDEPFQLSFMVAGIFLFNGFVSTIFSIIWGRLCDYIGCRIVTIIHQILVFGLYGYMILRTFDILPIQGYWWHWWIVASIEGTLDTNAVGMMNFILSREYAQKDAPYIFAWYRFIYCIGLTIFSLISSAIPLKYIVLIIFIWSFVSTIFTLIYHAR